MLLNHGVIGNGRLLALINPDTNIDWTAMAYALPSGARQRPHRAGARADWRRPRDPRAGWAMMGEVESAITLFNRLFGHATRLACSPKTSIPKPAACSEISRRPARTSA
jgi:hypothetical protein